MTRTKAVDQPSGQRRRGAWLLPEDGIIDEVAVELAATGARAVALTPTERRLAAIRILRAGGTVHRVARRLHMSYGRARALATQIATSSQPERAA
jgi:hypothetical protein